MAYAATAYKVFIASPSDVAKERQIIREVLLEWNCVHSEDRAKVLMPIGWETHSSPAMGEGPQKTINRQALRGCDLLVAVFWTRLGTPTDTAPSGTVEEIEEHIATGKPAMIYFSTAPVHLDSVDRQQYEALCAFRKRFEERGLVATYETLSEFRDGFSRHLALTAIRDLTLPGEQATQRDDEDRSAHRRTVVKLSQSASELLREAVKDENGIVIRLGTMAGLEVQTNGRNFAEGGDPRSEARWNSALQELCAVHVLEDQVGKGEVFNVTDLGYQIAGHLVAEEL
jgi:Domain of unknown function (DUF4062)